ncbi:hypothetical protein ABZ729_35825 [Streptomyces sp. NPDC006678]|uniref:hypothetical protein n=1 Tax=Streptomyces sp. NPDC006678 TaxID=3157185 RepID=UPI0033FFE92A
MVALSDAYTADQVLSLAASGELHARHPLAQAIVARAEEQHLHVPIHQACEVVLGMGMRAELVGSPALLRQKGVALTGEARNGPNGSDGAARPPSVSHDRGAEGGSSGRPSGALTHAARKSPA